MLLGDHRDFGKALAQPLKDQPLAGAVGLGDGAEVGLLDDLQLGLPERQDHARRLLDDFGEDLAEVGVGVCRQAHGRVL
ncbi:hypothetical protein D3C83_41520 [compost metagenome]